MKTILTKRYELSLTHIVEEDNIPGGPPELHGHSIKVDVSVAGAPDPETGEVVSRRLMDEAFDTFIAKPFNRKRINDFWGLGTGEIIASKILEILKAGPLQDRVISVQLVETRKNRFISY